MKVVNFSLDVLVVLSAYFHTPVLTNLIPHSTSLYPVLYPNSGTWSPSPSPYRRYKWSDLSPPLYSSPSKVTLIAANPFHVVIARQHRGSCMRIPPFNREARPSRDTYSIAPLPRGGHWTGRSALRYSTVSIRVVPLTPLWFIAVLSGHWAAD